MQYSLDKEKIEIRFFRISGIWMNVNGCFPSYVRKLYGSSEIMNKSCSSAMFAMVRICSSERMFPVGLPGLQIRIAFVLGVMAFLSSFVSRVHWFSSIKGTKIGVPPVSMTCSI